MVELDGTKNKGKLGANAVLAVSIEVCKAGAAEKGMEIIDQIRERFVDRVHFDSAPRREGNHCMMVMSPLSRAGKGGGKREQHADRDRGR